MEVETSAWPRIARAFGMCAVVLMATCTALPACAASFGIQITVPAMDLLVGDRITAAAWPDRVVRTPDEDGQFEVLVRKAAISGIDATACRSSWLLVRMPAVLPPVGADYHPRPRDPANQQRLDATKAEYAELQAAAAAGRPAGDVPGGWSGLRVQDQAWLEAVRMQPVFLDARRLR